jgi:Glycosyltransferases, probably involved in cell wall biogenesis
MIVLSNPLVSVIVPTFNNSRTIEKCVKSVSNQSYKNIELIVVDNDSSDGTKKIVQECGATVLTALCGRSEARTIGAKSAKGVYVFHIDSDMELDYLTIEDCVSKCEQDNFDAIIINEVNIANNFLGRCFDFEKRIYKYSGLGYARFMKLALYTKIGGHNKNLVNGEDCDLQIRLEKEKARIGFSCRETKHLIGKPSLNEILTKSTLYYKTGSDFTRIYPEMGTLSNKLSQFPLKTYCKAFLDDPLGSAGYFLIAIYRNLYARYILWRQ